MPQTDSELSGISRGHCFVAVLPRGFRAHQRRQDQRGSPWASWADCLKMVRQRHPAVADTMVSRLVECPVRCFEAVRRCAQSLTDAGFEPPSWTELANSQEVVFSEDPEPHEPKVGWQQKATKCLHRKFMEDQHWMTLADAEKAVMHSQRGPLASASFHDDAHQQDD